MAKFEKHRIFWQILLWWGGWLVISFILSNGFQNPQPFFRRAMASFIGIAVIVVVNIQYLLPQLYFRKKQVGFVTAGIALLLLVVVLIHSDIFPWSEWFDYNPKRNPLLRKGERLGKAREAIIGFRWLGHMMPFVIAFLGSTLVEIARFANKKEKEAIRSEKEKLETELKFLKSQVNPHFLFNALNNIYSLTVAQAPQAPESVMQLSEILRYMVYDSNEGKVPLKNEINYIENYVNLKLLKDSRGMDVQLDLDKSAPEMMIAPLLFIPFVENAFKHSQIENLKSGHINIALEINEGELNFSVCNSLPKNNFTKDKVGGVGLENIKKRLELLYPDGQHILKIHRTENEFNVWLKLYTK